MEHCFHNAYIWKKRRPEYLKEVEQVRKVLFIVGFALD